MGKAMPRNYTDLTFLQQTEEGRRILAHLTRYCENKKAAAKLAAQTAESRKVLSKFMQDNSLEGVTYRTNSVLLNVKDVPRFDSTLLKDVCPDILEQFTVVNEGVIEVRPAKKVDDESVYTPGTFAQRMIAAKAGDCEVEDSADIRHKIKLIGILGRLRNLVYR